MQPTHKKTAPGPLAVLGILGLAAALSGCWRSAGEVESDGRALAVQFLDDLQADRVPAAWARTTTDFKSLMGLENLRGYVKTHPALKGPAEFSSSRPVDRNGIALTEYVFHASAPPPKRRKAAPPPPATVKLLVIELADGFAVENITVE
jgi:hypothetical protein